MHPLVHPTPQVGCGVTWIPGISTGMEHSVGGAYLLVDVVLGVVSDRYLLHRLLVDHLGVQLLKGRCEGVKG